MPQVQIRLKLRQVKTKAQKKVKAKPQFTIIPHLHSIMSMWSILCIDHIRHLVCIECVIFGKIVFQAPPPMQYCNANAWGRLPPTFLSHVQMRALVRAFT